MKWHGYLDQTDYWVILAILLISVIGLVMVHSATYNDPSTALFVWKQLLWVILGLSWMALVTGYDYHDWLNYSWWLYGFNIVLLLVVLLVGKSAGGAARWIGVGPFQFQPSELSKIILILALSRYINDFGDQMNDWRKVLGAYLLIGIPMLMIMKQPDLGTSLTLVPVLFAILFIAGTPVKYLAYPVIAGVILSPIAFSFLKTYQKNRLLIFINPQSDPLGAGYNVIQSIIAVGSGGFLGKGWLKGTQTQLDFLPANHTDFAFSTFAEQFGFIGCILVLVLFGFMLVRMLGWTRYAKDTQGILLIVGVVTLLLGHVLINIGMTIGIMPVTGLPLPMVSYGGSSYLTFMTALGLAINVHQRRYTY